MQTIKQLFMVRLHTKSTGNLGALQSLKLKNTKNSYNADKQLKSNEHFFLIDGTLPIDGNVGALNQIRHVKNYY